MMASPYGIEGVFKRQLIMRVIAFTEKNVEIPLLHDPLPTYEVKETYILYIIIFGILNIYASAFRNVFMYLISFLIHRTLHRLMKAESSQHLA